MPDAYLLHISVEDGHDDTEYRILVSPAAYRFIEQGGPIPSSVLVDAALHFDVTYIEERFTEAQQDEFYDDATDPILRALLMVPSAFDGAVCDADDINALIRFATEHRLTITEDSYHANEDAFTCLNWYAMRDDHLTRIERGVSR